MRYDLRCPVCDEVTEVECRVAERGNQTCCKCSTMLENVTLPTSRIMIPLRFHTNWEDQNDHPRVDHTGV